MKWVWASLALFAVIVASYAVWQRFGISTSGAGAQFIAPAGAVNATPTIKDRPEGRALAVFGKAPDFSLTERNGRPFSKTDLVGKPWIADFIFTSCAGQCPLMSLQMKKFQSQLGPETGFRFVSFSVDPDRDSPQVLSEYAGRYGAEKDRWFFLTGPKREINRILKEFFLSPVEEPAMHSIRFILVDGEGQIRGFYDSSEPGSIDQLIHDANVIARTTAEGG